MDDRMSKDSSAAAFKQGGSRQIPSGGPEGKNLGRGRGEAHEVQVSQTRPLRSKPANRDGRREEDGDGIAEIAAEAVRETAKAVAAQASELVDNVGEEVMHAAADQKDRGAEIMLGFARAISSAADEIREQSPVVARQFKRAANGVGRLSEGVRDKSVRQLVDVASGYARNQPVAFFAGAVLAGFAFSRFLKSGSPRAGMSRSGSGDSARSAAQLGRG